MLLFCHMLQTDRQTSIMLPFCHMLQTDRQTDTHNVTILPQVLQLMKKIWRLQWNNRFHQETQDYKFSRYDFRHCIQVMELACVLPDSVQLEPNFINCNILVQSGGKDKFNELCVCQYLVSSTTCRHMYNSLQVESPGCL